MDDAALPAETHALLVQLLRELFGSRAALLDYRVTNRRPDYFVLLARLREPSLELAIKLAGPRAPHVYPFQRTAAILRLVASHASVPLPQVLALDVSYSRWPWRYVVKTFIPGEEWVSVLPRMSAPERRDAYEQLGRAVADLHSIPFAAFGDLADDGAVVPEPDFLTALAARAARSIADRRRAELFLALLDERAALFSGMAGACLCHEDLHHHNVLFSRDAGGWKLATILDFDKAWAGHREIDLARMEFWRNMIGPGFRQVYNALRDLPDLYAQRRPIYQLQWCLEYAASTPEHLADTQRLCRELGIPPVESFD